METEPLRQGVLGEVRLPVLRRRPVLELLKEESRGSRVMSAHTRLFIFRERAQRRAARRFLCASRKEMTPERLGEIELFNFTGLDHPLIREAALKVAAKFKVGPFALLVLNEHTRLSDSRGPIPMAPVHSVRAWSETWRARGLPFGCIFIPSDFREDEVVATFGLPMREGGPRLIGRSDLIFHLLVELVWRVAAMENSRRPRRLLAGWKIDFESDPTGFAFRLVSKMRES